MAVYMRLLDKPTSTMVSNSVKGIPVHTVLAVTELNTAQNEYEDA